MLELALAGIVVGLAFFWRVAFDAGRSYQRKRSVLNPGEAIMIDMGQMRLMMTPHDQLKLKSYKQRRAEERKFYDDRTDAMMMAMAQFHVPNPSAAMKVTGL